MYPTKLKDQQKPLKILILAAFFLVPFSTFFCYYQQAGGAIVMDADATSALQKRSIAPTDDSFKFAWLRVRTVTIANFSEE